MPQFLWQINTESAQASDNGNAFLRAVAFQVDRTHDAAPKRQFRQGF